MEEVKPQRNLGPAGVSNSDLTVRARHAVDGEDVETTEDPSLHATVLSVVTASTPAAVRTTTDLTLEPGTMVGDYRIEGKLGEGGWGSVFSAIHPLIGKRAAVKVLKKELCAYPGAVERFIDEARAVNQIGHPNIVDIFTFGETLGGRSYFVMEWLKGETLYDRIDRGALNLEEICAIVKPLARALEAAHEKGIIHRDLKPANVFLVEVRGEYPNVKLLDFGIAKLATNDVRVSKTTTGEIIGTPQYIAPEQARGRQIDYRVDVYALGGMLFELLTGRTVFTGDNAADMIASHLSEPAPRPSSFAPSVPPDLDDLVVAMLEKDPDKRPALDQLCTVLDHVRAGATVANVVATRAASQPRRESRSSAPAAALAPAAPAATLTVRTRSFRNWLLIGGALTTAIIGFLVVRSRPTFVPSASEETRAGGGTANAVVSPEETRAGGRITTTTAVGSNDRPADAGATVQRIDPVETTVPSMERRDGGTTEKPEKPIPKSPKRSNQKTAAVPRDGKLVLAIAGASSFEVLVDKRKVNPGRGGEIPLSPGGHTVEVTAPGMITEMFRVDIGAGSVSRKVALKRAVSSGSESGSNDDQMLFRSGEVKGGKK